MRRRTSGKPRSWKRTRTAVARAQNWLCAYCGRGMKKEGGRTDCPRGVTLDHVLPLALGGTDDPANLVACCYECNHRKGGGWRPAVNGEGAA